jgi:hypothetical protein
MPSDGTSLEKRVTLFVDRSWQHFASPLYRSTFEILLNLPQDMDVGWQRQMLEAWFRIWSRYLPESKPSRRKTLDLMHYTVSVLSGLATTTMLAGEGAQIRPTELGFLKNTLVREFARAGQTQ